MPRMIDDRIDRWRRARAALLSVIREDDTCERRVALLVDAIWEEFGKHKPASWVGYYRLGDNEMTLGYRRDKPACSPIGLHGACGQVALSGRSLLVPDVRTLGDGYIACDPRDRSELVVPVLDCDGRVLGVLDLDSYFESAFDESDQLALEEITRDFLRSASLSKTSP